MGKWKAALAASILCGSSILALGATTGAALADSQAELSIASFGDIVVDGVHKRVFISDPAGGKIVATNYRGAVVGELTGLGYVDGLALSSDSSRLYAALSGAHAIAAVDTDTVRETARYPVGDRSPHSVAPVGDKLWFGFMEGDNGNFGSVDPADNTVHLPGSLNAERLQAEPVVRAGAAAPGTLVVADRDSADFWVYDVSSGTEGEPRRAAGTGPAVKESAFTADGSHLVRAANGAESQVRLGDLTTTVTYPALSRANGVDVNTDGRIAISVANQATGDDVYVFEGEQTSATQTIRLPEAGSPPDGSGEPPRDGIQDRGIAWEPAGPRLFAVARYRRAFRLWVLNDPAPTPALTVSAPATATRAEPLTIAGTSSLPAGTEIVVNRADLESAKAPVCTAVTDAAGGFACTDTPNAGGEVVYTAAFAGDEQYGAASARTTVTVSREAPALTLNRNGAVFAYGTQVAFTARLGATHTNRTVEIWADPYGDKPNRLIKSATVNDAGKVTARITLTRNTTVTARFAGDARYAPAVATSDVRTRVAISTAVSEHYQTGLIDSTEYHYFHRNTTPQFTTAMTAYPGRKQKLVVQFYADGEWRAWSSRFVAIDADGTSVAKLTGAHPRDVLFRVRSVYVTGDSGDSANQTTYGAWQHFTFQEMSA
ncbi:YncE family protein [Amorphoplanes digitatis]|uniref:Ig-like domain repeat protein n=1 Tax=Actinoplanes digitatis TaxID=1868 RepID=A0A7W7MTI4_9ACTN|nr:Ig-like domain repeat protein [Actinoplanes digitatis]MBB4766358.1 hypothetical protein [Actinoplanes digitatis]GID96063.1 hypothetical protein Adi01nite_54750 [Actinoplanes digitatis]